MQSLCGDFVKLNPVWQLYVESYTWLQYSDKFQFFALLPTDIDSLKHAIDRILHELIGCCFTLFILLLTCVLQRVLLTELFFGTKELNLNDARIGDCPVYR